MTDPNDSSEHAITVPGSAAAAPGEVAAATDDPDDRLRFAPEALAEIEAMMASDPAAAVALRDLLATMRQAAHAWHSGQYASFEDAMEALTGSRPQPVGLGDDETPAEDNDNQPA